MSRSPNAPFDRPTMGISMVVVGLFLFALQDVVIKGFSDRYSVLQIVFVRGLVAIIPILVAIVVTSGWRGVVAYRPRLLILKGLLGFVSYMGYYLAIAAMPLAEVVTIVFMAPIIVTVLSAIVLKEDVGFRRWVAVCVGFMAVLIVVGPSGRIAHLATMLAILSSLTYACSTFITRFIGPDDRPWTITLYSMCAFLIGSGVASVIVFTFASAVETQDASLQFLLRPWVVPEPLDGLLMVFLGVNAAAGFYCLINAYWVAPASVVAPFEYTYIIWAVLFGYLVWSEIPESTTLIGVTLLIASSAYIFRWELRRPATEPTAGFPVGKTYAYEPSDG